MAGHIDHGKTTLTKALTGVDTDRLKEEKLRNISIEPGFAPLVQSNDLQISIIDVPGHERFIRQMIAGVAGIDFVVLVIAGDEGVMPQTKEHLAILSLLGIQHGMVAITKIDKVEEEFLEVVRQDIIETVKGTFLERAPIYCVDSLTLKGIQQFKQDLIDKVKQSEKRKMHPSFRLPIDQVFTIKGHGVVVRGTVFDGKVCTGETVTVLPINKEVRVRQIQSHHEKKDLVYAGQRAALNLGGITHHTLKRGHVLVKDDFFTTTYRVDVVFTPLEEIKHIVKQRQTIKFHTGTSEVTGKMIFFDRNELAKRNNPNEELFIQIKLDEPVVVTRGDHFIIRRASPIETIGGGWIIDPNAKKHRFGIATIQQLKRVKDGTADERIKLLLQEKFVQTKEEIMRQATVTADELNEVIDQLIEIEEETFTLKNVFDFVKKEITQYLSKYHERYPLRQGMNKAEIISVYKDQYPEILVDYVIKTGVASNELSQRADAIALASFTPHFPKGWEKRMETFIDEWEKQGAEVEKMNELFNRYRIEESLRKELYQYLLHTNRAYEFDEGRLISQKIVSDLKDQLFKATTGKTFTIQTAREITGLTRKNLIPLLELFDRLGYTKRFENERKWLS